MNLLKSKRSAIILAVLVLLSLCGYWLFFSSFSSDRGHSYIYIDTDDTSDSVTAKLRTAASPRQMVGYTLGRMAMLSGGKVRPGRYETGDGVSTFSLLRNLRNGRQAPVSLVIPHARTLDDLAARLSRQLAADSAELATAFRDTALCHSLGCDTATLICLFIPNTYEVYWTISPKALLQRMYKESKAFWTPERQRQAASAGLSEHEVITLASIVDQETANDGEKPMVAGMYLNRLHQGMKLQADPTVKFALHDFTLKRILHEHLAADSPYNTYRTTGLPPGPICIPAMSSIMAVLNYAHHEYIYMCAKEDFSGTHNFAKTYDEHLRNAARYAAALNARGIK